MAKIPFESYNLIQKIFILLLLATAFSSSVSTQSCKVPFSLSFSERTTTSIKIKWFDSNINPLGWEVEVVKKGQTRSGTPNFPLITGREFTITELLPGTAYELYIRTVCSSSANSAWNVAIPFITVLDIPMRCGSNIPLKDNGTEVLWLDVKEQGVLGSDVYLESVDVILEHDWPADLQLTLESPEGQQVVLSNHNGINTDDFGDINDTTCRKVTTFSPNACISLKDSKPPYIGSFKMDGDMSSWRPDTLSKGYWKLISFDRALKDVGSLKYINLKFNNINCLAPENFKVAKSDVNSIIITWSPQASCHTVKLTVYRDGEFLTSYSTPCGSGTFEIKQLLPNAKYEISIASVCSFGIASQESCRIIANTTCEAVTLAESFDNKSNCQTGCASPCVFTGSIWYNPKEDGAQDWIINGGSTDTPNTGPTGDINGTGKYIYLENNPSLCLPDVNVVLQSGCIKVLSNPSGCDMSFYYHMYGTDITSLRLEISTDNGLTWQKLYAITGNQGDKWQRVTLSLSPYHNQLAIFRFVAVSGKGALNDIALDQIEFYKSVMAPELTSFYADGDNDGFGSEETKIQICANVPPPGYAARFGDCDDKNNKIYPGATEIQCNGIDENCNGNQDDKASTNPINIAHQITKSSCNGSSDGSIDLTISGGNGPYEVIWNNGQQGSKLQNVQAGTYFATIKDVGGCNAKSDFIQLTASGFLNAVVVEKRDVSCLGKNDGFINIEHTTGNGPYKYQWSNNSTTKNLTTATKGIYSVTLTDVRNCSAILNNINVDAKPKVLVDVVELIQPLCFQQNTGQIRLSPSSGVSPYKYIWNNGATIDRITGLTNGLYTCTITDNAGCQAILMSEIKSPPLLSGKIISTENVRCHGESNGSIKTDISGGIQPYSYFWSNFVPTDDIFGLKAGNYTLTVTDGNGCKQVLSDVKINEPPLFELKLDSIAPSTCLLGKNGFIKVKPLGGNGNYNFVWGHSEKSDSMFNTLNSGNYNVTSYDKFGCKASIPNIFLPSVNDEVKIQLNLIKDNTCYNDKKAEISFKTENDKTPFDYNWSFGSQYFSNAKSDTIKSLPAGLYIVTITDNKGCTGVSNSILIQEKPIYFYTVASVKNNICHNDTSGSIKINISGGSPPYGVLWNGGLFSGQDINRLPSNTYEGIIADSKGCKLYILPIKIVSSGNIRLESSITHDVNNGRKGKICISLSGGVAPYQWVWSYANSKDTCISNLAAGTYSVTITDGSGCISIHDFKVENLTNTLDLEHRKVSIYPNPSSEEINIESRVTIKRIKIQTIDGFMLYSIDNINNTNVKTNVSDLKSGLYIITIHTGEKVISKPIVVIK